VARYCQGKEPLPRTSHSRLDSEVGMTRERRRDLSRKLAFYLTRHSFPSSDSLQALMQVTNELKLSSSSQKQEAELGSSDAESSGDLNDATKHERLMNIGYALAMGLAATRAHGYSSSRDEFSPQWKADFLTAWDYPGLSSSESR